MQLAQGHYLNVVLALCYLHLVAASRSYTCAQVGLDAVSCAGGYVMKIYLIYVVCNQGITYVSCM